MNVYQKYLLSGLSVVPTRDKICTLSGWKKYQEAPATKEEASSWAGDVAIICGRVSGGVTCLDFDAKYGDRFADWLKIVNETCPETLSKLVMENTPSGGYHVIFRSNKSIKNMKLACNQEGQATIETRGEGGYFVCAPSVGYKIKYGDFADIQTITEPEAEMLISAAASLNEKYSEHTQPAPEIKQTNGLSPFDDYNQRHDIVGLLTKHGWRVTFKKGETVYFQRPGKEGRGISATWNAVPDRFYVFSTATGFESQHVYKPSAVYAMLEHGGDFTSAAKGLFKAGYGVRGSDSMPKTETAPKTTVISVESVAGKLDKIYDEGYIRGATTGWTNLDCFYSVIKGQFTVVTGMPSHGKSEFTDALLMNLAIKCGWKFAVFAPENYPVEMHYHKLIEKYIKKSLTHGEGRMTRDEMHEGMRFVSEHFFFIDATHDEITLEAILEEAQRLIKEKGVDGLLLDPWNEIELDKPKDISSTEYIGKCLRVSRKFARRNNIHLWIVAHPIKMRKDQDGRYPVPELYDIEGSAHWRNKADNGICVHRDFVKDFTQIHIQKIKYRYCGKPGTVYLKYNKQNGDYHEVSEQAGRFSGATNASDDVDWR